MNEAVQFTAIERREHRLPPAHGDDSPLVLQEAVAANGEVRSTPVMLLHGATFGSAMFDIPVSGYSMQHFLAVRGWRNFALDVRGYGRSARSAVLDAPPEDNEPYARLGDAVDDLTAGVRFVLDETGSDAIHIVGFSWGTAVACVFAARHPGLVENLVLNAPLFGEWNELWIERLADPDDPTRINPGLGAYRWIREGDIRARWDADIPAGARADDYREENVLRGVVETLSSFDSAAGERSEPSFRVPAGALFDLFEIFNGRPLYEPQLVGAPTLVIRGHDDTTSTRSDALALLEALGTTEKRYVEVCPGSHFLCAERNATTLFGEIELFLGR